MVICKNFINRPLNSYRPLACKQPVFTTRDIKGTGAANWQNMFFIFKPNTLRERATLDLLYPTPNWLRDEIFSDLIVTLFQRITTAGDNRVTVAGDDRVTAN